MHFIHSIHQFLVRAFGFVCLTLFSFNGWGQTLEIVMPNTEQVCRQSGEGIYTMYTIHPHYRKGKVLVYTDATKKQLLIEAQYKANRMVLEGSLPCADWLKDELISFKQYFPSGKLYRELSWAENLSTLYHSNGNKSLEKALRYDNPSEATIREKHWYENGQIKSEKVKKGDTLFALTYYESGSPRVNSTLIQVQKSSKYDTWQDLRVEEYYPNGQLHIRTNYNWKAENKPAYIAYHANGQFMTQLDKMGSRGMLIGPFKTYRDNGKLLEEGEVIDHKADGSPTSSIPHGEWKYYDENGLLIKKVKYAHGEVLEEKELKK